MSRYAHTQQGACSLRIFSDNILLRSMGIERAGWKLEESLNEYGDSIGIYKEKILELIDSHRTCLTSLSQTAHEIADFSEEITHSIQQNDLGHTVIINDYGDGLKLEPWFPAFISQMNELLDELEENEEKIKWSGEPIQLNMSMYEDVPDIPRMYQSIYFVIETSSRIAPSSLQAIKEVFEEILPELNFLAEEEGVNFKIQTIIYNIGAHCLDKELILTTEYDPHEMEPFGLNNVGEAFKKVNSLINLAAFLRFDEWPGFAPMVFYLIGSNPTDDFSYGVHKLQQNNFYRRHCEKYVYFMGDGQDRNMYLESIGKDAKVLQHFTVSEIIKTIKFVELKEDWFDCSPEFIEIRHWLN